MTERNKLEAVLFASAKKLSEDELKKLTHCTNVHEVLSKLRLEYEEKETAIKLIEEPEGWRITIKEKYIPFVKNISTETELSRSVMETLGVIAWKYPALQSDIIKIRTNKAYDHLDLLEEAEFIKREKSGRTKRIRLTDKFFSYFDLPKNKQGFKEFVPEHIRQKLEEKEASMDKSEQKIEDEIIKDELQKQHQKQIDEFEGEKNNDATSTMPKV